MWWHLIPWQAKAGAGALLVAAGCYWWGYSAGYSTARTEAAQAAAEAYKEGTKDAGDATANVPDNDAGVVDWLRDFAN